MRQAKSAEGDDLRFTRKGDDLYVTVLGKPKAQTITLADVPAKQGVASQPARRRGFLCAKTETGTD